MCNIKFTDYIFYTSQILKQKQEYKEAVQQLFTDFMNAYDSVSREVLCNILIEFGIHMHLDYY
jgi:hypothetical protein